MNDLSFFLHNIYYRYLSKRYKNALKCLKLNNVDITIKVQDARNSLKETSLKYDRIFLDAFSPAKCPSLWTLDFFKLLHERLDDDGMILTYSNSANIRNAFLQAGFFIGKTSNEKNIGTIAVKNESLIKNTLSEFDLGLINSKAGIIYRDEGLNLDNSEILAQHAQNVAASSLISSSKYIKQARRSNEI